jgi:hypothetical protein
MNLLERIKFSTIYPTASLIINIKSSISHLKSLVKKTDILFQRRYSGEKILLIALYEKGQLRSDIHNLIKTAKELDLYVVAVNTLKIAQPEKLEGLIDCYIERPNYGRDFGSYKTGFLHLFKEKWHESCSRLLMLNDSLFYSKKNLKAFLEEMINSDIEVLGATENNEIEHHLGSFCIAFDSCILNNSRFQKYWKGYSNSDVRPVVIKNGEMGLSKVLRRCVSSPEQFQALFNLSWMARYLDTNKDFINELPEFYPVSNLVGWERPSLKSAADRFMRKYLQIDPGLASIKANIDVNIDEKTSLFVHISDSLISAMETVLKGGFDTQDLSCRVREAIINNFLSCFSYGSQVHQNGIVLHHIGLPFVKLDALYRGMFEVEDVEKIASQLTSSEKQAFRNLLYSKPFGGAVLVGWQRAAFYRGLI